MNKYKLYMILGIIVLVLSVGSSFAYYIWKSTSNALVSLNVCTPTITFAGGSTINGVDMIPVLTKEEGTIKDIEVKKNSTCNRDVTMNLYLELTTFPIELSDSSFVYELYKNSETMAIASGNFSNKEQGNTITLLSNQILNTSKDTYTLYIYIDGNVDNPSTMAGKNFLFKLWGSGEGAIYKENVITTPDSATGSTSKFFNTEVMREEIQSLTIAEDNTVPDTPGVVSKDISQNKDGTVMLWYTPKEVASSDGSTKTMYDMWIGGENGVLQTGTNASGMFAYLTNIEKLDLSKLDTSYITNMSRMFYMSSGLKSIDLSNFNTSNVTSMQSMFEGCSNLTSLDLNSFNTSKVSNMSYMFYKCKSLKKLNISGFDTINLNNMNRMFWYCSSLISLDLSNFDTSNVTTMERAFADCSSLVSLNLTNLITNKVVDMSYMFNSCKSLISIDISGFNTSNVTNMEGMFGFCQKIVTLSLTNFNTSKVTKMANMFQECVSLIDLNLTSFDTSNVVDMRGMFQNCKSLTTINLLNFDTSNVTNMWRMFLNCSSLKELDLSNFTTSKVTNMESMFHACVSMTELDLSNFTTAESNLEGMFMYCEKIEILNIRNFDFQNVNNYENIFKQIKSNVKIIVKDNTQKNWLNTNFSNLTNIVVAD